MVHRTQSPTGYRLTPVARPEGEYAHRIGCLDDLKPSLGLAPDDGYTVCLVLDGSDPRLCLGGRARRIPILFRFDCEWGNDHLVCRLAHDGSLAILAEPWGDVIGSPSDDPEWWPHRGDFALRLEPVPQRLHDILSHVTGSWCLYQDELLRRSLGTSRPLTRSLFEEMEKLPEWQTTDYVNQLVFCGRDAFHYLGGLPVWVQDPLTARCPDCGQEIPLLLSLDSDRKLGWCFGDAGRLYAFYCQHCSVVISQAQCT